MAQGVNILQEQEEKMKKQNMNTDFRKSSTRQKSKTKTSKNKKANSYYSSLLNMGRYDPNSDRPKSPSKEHQPFTKQLQHSTR